MFTIRIKNTTRFLYGDCTHYIMLYKHTEIKSGIPPEVGYTFIGDKVSYTIGRRDQISVCGDIIYVKREDENYSDRGRTYKEARKIANEWAKVAKDDGWSCVRVVRERL